MTNEENPLGADAAEVALAGSIVSDAAPHAELKRTVLRGSLATMAAVAAMAPPVRDTYEISARASGYLPAHVFRESKGSTPNKYQPHQGAREKARRVRQMERAAKKTK